MIGVRCRLQRKKGGGVERAEGSLEKARQSWTPGELLPPLWIHFLISILPCLSIKGGPEGQINQSEEHSSLNCNYKHYLCFDVHQSPFTPLTIFIALLVNGTNKFFKAFQGQQPHATRQKCSHVVMKGGRRADCVVGIKTEQAVSE